MKRYVVYLRVSTTEQGKKGHGLDAQRRDIAIFLERFSEEPYEIIAEHQDIQSGKDDDRPELTAALALVRATPGAELLVSKLDRLSRKVSFIASLMDDKRVRLRIASMPYADKFQLHIYAALAEQEREFISLRTKAALGAAKAKGAKLGGLRDKTGERNKAVQRNAAARAQKVASIVEPMRARGDSLRAIAEALNKAGVVTARGGEWHPSQIARVLERLG